VFNSAPRKKDRAVHDIEPKGAGLGSNQPLLELPGVLPFTSLVDDPSIPL